MGVQKKKKRVKASQRLKPSYANAPIQPEFVKDNENFEADSKDCGFIHNIVGEIINSIFDDGTTEQICTSGLSGKYDDKDAMEKCILSDLQLCANEDLEDEVND